MKAAGFFPPSTDFNLKPFDLKIWYLITLWMRFRIIENGLDRIGSTGLGGCRAIPHAVQPDRLVDWIKSKKWNILFILLRCCCPLSRVHKRWSASTWTDHIDHAPNIQSECNCHAATPKRGRGEQGVGGRGFFEIFLRESSPEMKGGAVIKWRLDNVYHVGCIKICFMRHGSIKKWNRVGQGRRNVQGSHQDWFDWSQKFFFLEN